MNTIEHFSRFTERARKVLGWAEEEALHLQHPMLGTEHILLGLVREGENVLAQVLAAQGVTLEQVREAAESAQERGAAQGEIVELTPHAHMALEMAMKRAERQFFIPANRDVPLKGTTYITESAAAQILQDAQVPSDLALKGITLEQVRTAVEESKERGGRGVMLVIDQNAAINKPAEEAERRRHPFFHVNVEQVLVGILQVPEGAAVKILHDLAAPSPKDLQMLMYLEHATTMPLTYQEYAQRFTQPARKAWRLAHEEARRRQDSFVGSEHLLLGLVAEGSGVAATVLAEMGVGLEQMREKVKPGYEPGDWSKPDEIKLPPNLKHLIEQAANQTRRLSSPSIGTGHLLLALVTSHEDQTTEAVLLRSLGVDMDNLRATLRRVLADKTGARAVEVVMDEDDEDGIYAANASIVPIERDLRSRELDRAMLALYPFTLEARLVLSHARLSAENLAQRVGPEHLLVGLAYLTFNVDGPVRQVFKDVGIDFARAQAAVENRQASEAPPTSIVLVGSALYRAYLLLAADEAERRDGPGSPITSEHLLLGLLREENGIIADLLSELGTNVETVRTKLLGLMKDSSVSKN